MKRDVKRTAYMLVAIPFEERDLVDLYGESYEDYRRRVPALVPRPGMLFTGEVRPVERAV